MGRTASVIKGYGSLGLLLVCVAALATGAITSCGGGGGDADGGLCSECGVSPDGPCLTSVTVEPGPDAPPPCNAPGAVNPCPVSLVCRRKVDSAQQRCFPAMNGVPDPTFECDGSRPGGTAIPEPTPTITVTPQASCGNGVLEGTEECDGTDFGGQSCGNFCDSDIGSLQCTTGCALNFSLCLGGNCEP